MKKSMFLMATMGVGILYALITFPPPTTKLDALGFGVGGLFSILFITLGLFGLFYKEK